MFTVSKNAKKKPVLSRVSKKISEDIFHMAYLDVCMIRPLGFIFEKERQKRQI